MKARVEIESSDGDCGPIDEYGHWKRGALWESSGFDTLFTSIGEAVKRHEEAYVAEVTFVTVELYR